MRQFNSTKQLHFKQHGVPIKFQHSGSYHQAELKFRTSRAYCPARFSSCTMAAARPLQGFPFRRQFGAPSNRIAWFEILHRVTLRPSVRCPDVPDSSSGLAHTCNNQAEHRQILNYDMRLNSCWPIPHTTLTQYTF